MRARPACDLSQASQTRGRSGRNLGALGHGTVATRSSMGREVGKVARKVLAEQWLDDVLDDLSDGLGTLGKDTADTGIEKGAEQEAAKFGQRIGNVHVERNKVAQVLVLTELDGGVQVKVQHVLDGVEQGVGLGTAEPEGEPESKANEHSCASGWPIAKSVYHAHQSLGKVSLR